MTARFWAVVAGAAVALANGAAPALAADSGLDAYSVPASGTNLAELHAQGFDVNEGRSGKSQEVVATAAQAQALTKLGIKAKLKRDAAGRTTRQSAERGRQPDGSYVNYRPYFDPTYVGTSGGKPRQTLYEEYAALAAKYPSLVKLEEIGRTLNDKPIIALRITKDAKDTPRSERPSVLYLANQHAREWITAETIRREIHYFLESYGTDATVTDLVNTRELWFVPVANPDGYDFTFTPGNRLWRKNLREVNGIPGTQAGDGVDPNRNFPANWGLDDEGSSPDPGDETYRGSGPASEAETQAIDGLLKAQDFSMVVNYHSASELLLYGLGSYVETTTPDDPIYRALSGTDADPAIKGVPNAPNAYDPDVSAELYTTNGDTDEYVYSKYKALSWTPEMDVADKARGAVGETGGEPSGFEFEDSDADLQAVLAKNLPFALDVAKSAADPAEASSHLGNTVPDYQLMPFSVSYGSPQTVAVRAKKSLGAVTVRWSINGGDEQSAPTTEFKGGERFGGGGAFFHELRGVVTGAQPGDTVRVRFVADGATSPSFRYDQAVVSDAPVLLLAAENQKGPSSFPATPASDALMFDQPYADALNAAGVTFDTYDVDGRGGVAPDALGVLSHYKAVIWYTGNNLLTRIPGQPGGTGEAKYGNDITLAVRAYLNEGGKLLNTGQNITVPSSGYVYNPQGEPPYCDNTADPTISFNPCVAISNDFLQYWEGAYLNADVAGNTDGEQGDKDAVAAKPMHLVAPYGDAPFDLNGGTSKDNQAALTTALTSESALDGRFPSQPFAAFDGVGAFSPPDGTGYAVAKSDDEGYQRLRKTVDLTGATSGELDFKLSYNTEPDYDYVFVEAHTVGQDDWTTLPDANGHTALDGGQSCLIDWRSLHPFIDHYQTPPADVNAADAACDPHGTTGEFNAATGSSGGFGDWKIDLSAYAGKQVELSVTYALDFGTSGLGVFLDDAKVVKDGATVEQTSFEGGSLGGFTAGPPPAGSEDGTQGSWISTGDLGLVTGPGVTTPDTVYLTFGFEGVREAGQRQAVMNAALTHLGVPVAGPAPAPPPPPAPGPAPAPPGGKPLSPLPTLTLGRFRASATGNVPIRAPLPGLRRRAGLQGHGLDPGRLADPRRDEVHGQGRPGEDDQRPASPRRRGAPWRATARSAWACGWSNQSGGAKDTIISTRYAKLKAPPKT